MPKAITGRLFVQVKMEEYSSLILVMGFQTWMLSKHNDRRGRDHKAFLATGIATPPFSLFNSARRWEEAFLVAKDTRTPLLGICSG